MDPKRYRQVRQIFDEAMALDATGVFADSASAAVIGVERWEGRRLGPYEILHELGEGGMGVVYLARRADGAFEKQVAIKVVRQSLATREFLARFQREREILAKLEHTNIARLLDGGSAPNGLAYLVMEYVKGEPLLAYADSRRLPYDNRLRLLRQIAEAVDYAHGQGVVHRDLKPSNILVSTDGQVKLLDFGIASWQEPVVSAEASAPTIALSPAYASPEQARGERTTKASDIYSFGMVGYELLAGVLPFDTTSKSVAEMMLTIIERQPKLPSVAVRTSKSPRPVELGRLRRMAPALLTDRLEKTADGPLLGALSKRREDRPQFACDLVRELEGELEVRTNTLSDQLHRQMRTFGGPLTATALIAGLAMSGELSLKPFGWFAVALALGYWWIRQAAWAKWIFENSAVIAGALFVVGPSFLDVSQSAKTPQEQVILAAPMVFFALLMLKRWLPYFRRARILEKTLYVAPRGTSLVPLLLGTLMLAALVLSRYKGKQLKVSDLLLFVVTLGSSGSLFPFEVGARGLVARGVVFRWSDLEGYRWLSGADLELKLRKHSIWVGSDEIKVDVDPDHAETLQEILQDYLIESPHLSPGSVLGDINPGHQCI